MIEKKIVEEVIKKCDELEMKFIEKCREKLWFQDEMKKVLESWSIKDYMKMQDELIKKNVELVEMKLQIYEYHDIIRDAKKIYLLT